MRLDAPDILQLRPEAYGRLFRGFDARLTPDNGCWTEKIGLSLVWEMLRSRLSGLAGIAPGAPEEEGQE